MLVELRFSYANIYTYVNNNPLRYTDRLGLWNDSDYSGSAPPWLLGTFVHTQFSNYIDSLGNIDLQTNTTLENLFNRNRPDVVNTLNENVWELKPASCKVNPGNRDAKKQLQNYVNTANQNGSGLWSVGSSNDLIPTPVVRYGSYGGNNYEITYYPDTNSSSGLIYYDLKNLGPSCPNCQ